MTIPDDPWVQMKFRIRRSLHARLEKTAVENDLSLNQEIANRLIASFEAARLPLALLQQHHIALAASINLAQQISKIVDSTSVEPLEHGP